MLDAPRAERGIFMNEFENAFEVIHDDRFIEWLINYGKSLKPKSKEAYKKLWIAYFEYLKARCEDSEPSEPSQSEGE